MTASVTKDHSIFIEIRSSAIVLTEVELRRRLGVSKVPKQLKSLPQIKLPRLASDPLEASRGELQYEDLLLPRPGIPPSHRQHRPEVWSANAGAPDGTSDLATTS